MEQYSEILRILSKQSEQLAAQTERIKSMQASVSKIGTTLHGNGQKGLCDRVTVVESQMKSIKSKLLWITGIGGVVAATIVVRTLFP